MPGLPEDERARLAEHYAEMPEAELADLAEKAYSLTEAAREVLQAEISRRGLALAIQTSPTDLHSDPGLVLLRRFRDLSDAWVAQSVLDSAGLESSLFDENIVRLNWFYSYAMKEVKLMVSSEDAADAFALLEAKPQDSFVASTGEYVQPRCVQCQSFAVSHKPLNVTAAYALTYLGLPIPFRREGWFCKDCRHQWLDPNEPLPGLQWPLIAALWSFGFLAAIVIFFSGLDSLAIWLWIAYLVISGASLTRFATHRRFKQAFIVGFVVGCVDWLAVCSYYYRQGGAILNSTAPIVFPYGISYIATFQGIVIVAVTWSVATVVRKRGKGIQKS